MLTIQTLKQLLTDNNIVIPAITSKIELFLILLDAKILERKEMFSPKKS